ncbi:hypothetical protein [Actinomadura geliboluensis]|uniref:DUF2812 domain-containing protein n=1 Tax=Actinomadura geliboluensis TaxID=882440 RepID=A0A5S4GML3_9ACTN|nr:hypothetical protein [Actinomadura geliboluensis]TMR34185.1 hypothetical protein ETD96_25755 [Actinomadura geliboluensis]
MTKDVLTYFQRLTTLLREQQMPQQRIEALVGELKAYTQEAGTEPAEEFGPAEELAAKLTERARLGATDAAAEPGDETETWVLRTDAFQEERLLSHFGAQGWEVDGLDRFGGFICRREPNEPMRWQYRRETATERGRDKLTEQLAPDGWELCGVWGPFAYYKRPEAASSGPAAQLAAPPAPPHKRVYFSRWSAAYFMVSLITAMATLVWLGWTLRGMSASERAGTAFGLLLLIALAWPVWKLSRRKRSSSGSAPNNSQQPNPDPSPF